MMIKTFYLSTALALSACAPAFAHQSNTCHLSGVFGLIHLPCSGDYYYDEPGGDDTVGTTGTIVDRTPPGDTDGPGDDDGPADDDDDTTDGGGGSGKDNASEHNGKGGNDGKGGKDRDGSKNADKGKVK